MYNLNPPAETVELYGYTNQLSGFFLNILTLLLVHILLSFCFL